MPGLDFWYSIGSTYSYLTVMRIADAAAQAVPNPTRTGSGS